MFLTIKSPRFKLSMFKLVSSDFYIASLSSKENEILNLMFECVSVKKSKLLVIFWDKIDMIRAPKPNISILYHSATAISLIFVERRKF